MSDSLEDKVDTAWNLQRMGFELDEKSVFTKDEFRAFRYKDIQVVVSEQDLLCHICQDSNMMFMFGVTTLLHVSLLKILMYGH